MRVCVILVPYDSGHRSARMGRGPEHLLENGLKDTVPGMGCEVRTLESEVFPSAEVSVAFELDRKISHEVRECRKSYDFPIVLSGNCNNSVGTMAGVGCEGLGVVWLDGHVDFNLPETTTTGFSDNMGLSIAVGDCWNAMAANVPGFSPVEERNVIVVGAREMEPAERSRLEDSGITLFGVESLRSSEGWSELDSALEELGERTRAVYLHLDLDVLDPELVGPANEFAPKGGLTTEEVEAVISLLRERCRLLASGIASYDPAFDRDGGVLRAGIRLARRLY